MKRVAQPLRWHGGKRYLATKIIDLMPPHKRYLEAFAGGLSVLIRKPCEGIAEWANDTNGELTNFWTVLATEPLFDEFKRMVDAVPLSETIFENSKSFSANNSIIGAVAFFVRMRQSRQGLGKDFCTPTSRTRRGMNEQVSAWLTAVDGLPEIHQRLRRVEIWKRDACDAIKRLDGEDLLVYADPPYVQSTRAAGNEFGDHEMSDDDHVAMLETLAGMKGKFILSGYPCEIYNRFARENRWDSREFGTVNHASSSAAKEIKPETVWSNFGLKSKNHE